MKFYFMLFLLLASLSSISQEKSSYSETQKLNSLNDFKFTNLAFNDETLKMESHEDELPPLPAQNPHVASTPITDYEKVKLEYQFSNITKQEKRNAALILEVRRNNQIDKVARQIRELSKSINSETSIFFKYHDWIETLASMLKTSNKLERLVICREQLATNKNSILFKTQLEGSCQQCLVDWLKEKKFSKKISTTEVFSIISIKPKFFLDSSTGDHLVPYINSLESKEKISFTDLLSLESIKQEFFPSPLLSKQLQSNSSFASYFQERGPNFIQRRKKIRTELSSKLMKTYSYGGEPVADLFYDNTLTEVQKMVSDYKVMLDEEFAASRLIVFSDFLTRNSRQDLARKNLEFIKSSYNISELNMVLYHFNYLWSYITAGDYQSSMKYVKEQKLDADFQKLDPQLKFWISYIYKEIREHAKALKNLKLLVEAHPVSYYGVMSLKLMKSLSKADHDSFFKQKFQKENASFRVPMDYMKFYAQDLKRIQIWSEMNTFGILDSEYKYLQNDLLINHLSNVEEAKRLDFISGLNHVVGLVVNSGKSYLSTFKLLWGALERRELTVDYFVLRTLFPTPIKDFLSDMKTDIDHVLLYALIRQESGFFSGAKSPVGATGLMQLMPFTAKLFERSISSVQLKNPEKNLAIGTRYLNKLLKRYDHNLVFTLAAYNAGESRVSQWQQGYFRFENILNNVESIPFQETRNYVKLIFRNIYFYKLIMETDVKDSLEFNQMFDLKLGFNK
ncbi:MAG: lytic transglycosylase domain-containing protein [Bacteriovoracaceae bacterium]|nr:lytic transglycosylase domain-containing protein [Bacteriovoracaceae bacterium]